MLQETLLRAWKRLESFEERSSLRAWLYKIATNASLDALDSRRVRGLPKELYSRGDPTQPLPAPVQANWVGPLPDEWIDDQPEIYPEARYEVRESITLAFIAALQKLPVRQRAVILLCDVMGWSSNEAADILDMTPAAVNSALQRARASLKQTERKSTPANLNEQLSSLLARYVAANAHVSPARSTRRSPHPPSMPAGLSARSDTTPDPPTRARTPPLRSPTARSEATHATPPPSSPLERPATSGTSPSGPGRGPPPKSLAG